MTDQPESTRAEASRSIRPSARTAMLLGLLVLVGFTVRIDALRNSSPPVPEFGDARAYHLLAENLAAGRGYIRPFEFREDGRKIATAEYPPALPATLALASTLGVSSETGHRLVLASFGALTVGLVGLVGNRLGGHRVAILSAGIAAVHPALWNADVTLMAEPLAAFAGAGLLLATLVVIDHPRARWWVVLGVGSGLAALVRSEFLLLGPALVGVALMRTSAEPPAKVRQAAVALVAMLVVLAPWTARNLATFGEIVPVSNNSGSVSRGANCDAAYEGPFRGLWVTNVALGTRETAEERGGCFAGFPMRDGVNEARAAAELRQDGIGHARDHLDQVPAVVLARVGRTVGVYQFDQQSSFAGLEGRNVTWERRGTRAFQGLAGIALVGLVVALRRRTLGDRLVLVVPPLVVLVTVAATYGNPRFRASAEPAVVVGAATALVAAAEAVVRAWGSRARRKIIASTVR